MIEDYYTLFERENDLLLRFQAYLYYIVAINQFIEHEYGCQSNMAGLLNAQKELKAYKKIQREKNIYRNKLKQLLYLSWASEIQMRMAGNYGKDLMQFANSWAPIHAYYSVYMSAQAWFLCMNCKEQISNHSSSLSVIANTIKERKLLPLPWSVYCTGYSNTFEFEFANRPDMPALENPFRVINQPSIENFWERYSVMLKTTRQEKLESRFAEWKRKHGRKSISKAEKINSSKEVSPTTIFDFFWRLRIRSNYTDITSFLASDVSIESHKLFYENIVHFTTATSALLQNIAVAYSGIDLYSSILKEFIKLSENIDCNVMKSFIESKSGI